MTIETSRIKNPTHVENLFCMVQCDTCEDILEEDGTPLGTPCTLAGITDNLTFEQALALAQKHERDKGKNHKILIAEVDFQKISDELWNENTGRDPSLPRSD